MKVQKLLFVVLMVVAFTLGSLPAQAQEPALTVWAVNPDVWQLPSVAAAYEKETGIHVTIEAFDSEDVLNTKLLVSGAAGEGPDIILGPHHWGAELHEAKLITGYCIEGSGACDACMSSNPPRWCQFAMGSDLLESANPDFVLGTAYCVEGGCPQCVSQFPPRWCLFASEKLAWGKFDVFQSYFLFPDGPFTDTIPVWWWRGKPSWWLTKVFVAPREAIGETKIDIATLNKLIENEGLYYEGTQADQRVWVNGDDIQFPGEALAQDQAKLFFVSTSQLATLSQQVKDLVVVNVDGFQPTLIINGAYLGAFVKDQPNALDLMYRLTDEDVQLDAFQATGVLPTDYRALKPILEDNPLLADVVAVAKQGIPYAPSMQK